MSSERGFWIACALLAILVGVPLFWVVHPPTMDLPGHLALATVIETRLSSSDSYAGLFSLPDWPSPNTLYYYIVGALGVVLPATFVSTLLVLISIVGTPIAMRYARVANGQSGSVAVVGVALSITFSLVAGFISFALALPLMIWLTGLARAQIEAPTRKRAAILAVVACLTYLTHAQVFLFSIGLVGLVALCGAWGYGESFRGVFRRMVYTVGPTLLAIAIATPWYLERAEIMQTAGGMDMHFKSMSHNWEYLGIHTFDILRGDWDIRLGMLIAAGLIALAVLSWLPWYRKRAGSIALWFRGNVYYLGALIAVITYFAMPSSVRFQQVINGRQAMVALMLLAIAVPTDIHRRIPRYVVISMIVASTAYAALFAWATIRMGRETGDLHALLSKARPNTRIKAPNMPKSKVFRLDVYRHVGSYHAVWNHGLVSNTFARVPIQPIRVTSKWKMPRGLYTVEYLLSGRRLTSPKVRLVDRSGLFYLYEVIANAPSNAPR